MDKTIVVAVESLKKHRIYKRTYKQTKRFHVHDEENVCQMGDLVRIEECRPLSKLKRWRLIEIVKPGSGIVPVEEVLAEVDPDLLSAKAGEADESQESAAAGEAGETEE
jgi:small subunit ribosomal protein S17